MGQIWSNNRENLTVEDKAIQKLVKDILKDQTTNNTLVPDLLEEKIYQNILKVVMSHIKLTLESTNIEFMNHKINFIVTPIEKESDNIDKPL